MFKLPGAKPTQVSYSFWVQYGLVDLVTLVSWQLFLLIMVRSCVQSRVLLVVHTSNQCRNPY